MNSSEVQVDGKLHNSTLGRGFVFLLDSPRSKYRKIPHRLGKEKTYKPILHFYDSWRKGPADEASEVQNEAQGSVPAITYLSILWKRVIYSLSIQY